MMSLKHKKDNRCPYFHYDDAMIYFVVEAYSGHLCQYFMQSKFSDGTTTKPRNKYSMYSIYAATAGRWSSPFSILCWTNTTRHICSTFHNVIGSQIQHVGYGETCVWFAWITPPTSFLWWFHWFLLITWPAKLDSCLWKYFYLLWDCCWKSLFKRSPSECTSLPKWQTTWAMKQKEFIHKITFQWFWI